MAKRTPLFEEHKKLNANIVDFAGWEMPVYYTTPIAEHNATREKAGLFDVSHMGEILVEGKQALELVQLLVTRDISKMKNGQMSLSVMCNEQGGIIDDLTVYKFSNEKFLLVVNAGTIEKDVKQAGKYVEQFDCGVIDESDAIAKIDLQGPKAEKILQKLTGFELKKIKWYCFEEFKVKGIDCIVSRSGYTGEDGFEIYFDAEKAAEMWNALLENGKESGLASCGLGARDTLRLECCMALYGHEIDETRSPLQGSYDWAVDFGKKNFIGKEALLEQKKKGLGEMLVAFEMVGRGIPRNGYKIFKGGKEIGVVTSGSFSPTLKKNIGMGYVKTGLEKTGNRIEIDIRGSPVEAEIVKKPFYSKKHMYLNI